MWLYKYVKYCMYSRLNQKGGFVDYEIDNTIDWGNGTEEIIPGYNYTQVTFYSAALSYCVCLVRRLWL